MAFEDVEIVIEVNKPGALTGLGTPLLLVSGATGGVYKQFADADGVKEEFGNDHIAYKLALVVSNQGQYRPSKIAVATYDEEKTSTDILEEFYDEDWYFVLSDVEDIEEKKALSDLVEGKGFKMAAHQVTTPSDAQTLTGLDYDRTIIFGVEPEHEDEHANVAFVGTCGSRTVGEITWKFKQLVGITPMQDKTLALAFVDDNANIYITSSSGKPSTREGVVASGEFIDVIHGMDWIKVNGKNSITAALENSPKVAYTDAGISQLVSALRDTLELAGRNEIIAELDNGQYDYSITALTRAETTPTERSSRVYTGLSFEFALAGAIHKVKPIKGVVNF